MRLFSYVITVDAGFAPNPYHDFCTLAVCKPKIRKTASVGDWVIGTGSKMKGLQNRLIYAMRVTEEMKFNAYWTDPRFRRKRPDIYGNRVQVRGTTSTSEKKTVIGIRNAPFTTAIKFAATRVPTGYL